MTSDREAVKTFQRILGATVLVPVNPKKTNRAPQKRGLSRSPARRAMNPTDEAKVEDGFGTDYSNAFTKRSTVNVTTPPPMDQQQGDDWPDEEPTAPQAPAISYPEAPDNPHNHRFTVSADSRGVHIAVRGQTAAEITQGIEELKAAGVPDAIRTLLQGAPAPRGDFNPNGFLGGTTQQPFPQPPQQPNQGYQGQPPWQTTGAAPGQFPQQQAQQGGNRQGPKPRPTDWPQVFKLTLNQGAYQGLKDFRQSNQQLTTRKIYQAARNEYWVHPDIAQMVTQFGMVVPA